MNALEIHVKLVKLLGTSLCPTAKQVALKFTMYLVNKDFSLSHVQFFFFFYISPQCILAVKNANSLLGCSRSSISSSVRGVILPL